MKYDLVIHVDAENEQVMKMAFTQAANYKKEALTTRRTLSPVDIAVKAGGGALETEAPFRIIVVINGPAVRLLTQEHEELLGAAQQAVSTGVKFHAGAYALDNYGVAKEQLWSFVEVVPSATLDIVKLEHEGFSYLKP